MDMIFDPADDQRGRFLSIEHLDEIAVNSVLDFRGDEGLSVLCAEDEMNED
jgi:hypothetical protein